MTPLYLSFQAFGPYPEKQEIDFAALRRCGLFLIRGETGAGKTAILDAITFALYGRSSGGGRGDLTAMRCQQAGHETQTQIVFECELNGRVCRFIRGLQPRKKRSGVIEYLPRQDALFQNADGDWEPFFENPRMRDIEELSVQLTGLQYDQFRQVIVLPQGQFERLLIAPSDEKERLLTSLFGTGEWGRASDLLGEQANALARKTEQLAQDMRTMLSEHNCDGPQALDAQIEACRADEHRACTLVEAMRERVQAQQDVLEQAAALEQTFLRLDRAQEAMSHLRALSDEMEQKRRLLQMRELVELYQRWQEMEHVHTAAQEDAALLQAACDSRNQELIKTRTLYHSTEALQKEYQAQADQLPVYAAHLHRMKENEAKSIELAGISGTLERLRRDCEQYAAAYQAALEASMASTAQYLEHIQYELASRLRQGKPCPVCGSTAHPAPASKPHNTVGRDDLARCQDAVSKVDRTLTACEEKYNTLEAQLKLEQEKLARNGGYRHADLLEAQKAVDTAERAHTRAKELAQKCTRLSQSMETLIQEMQTLQAKREAKALAAARTAEGACQLAAQLDAADPDGSLRARLGSLPHETDFAALEEALSLYDRQRAEAEALCAALSDQVADIQRPSLAQLRQRTQVLSEELAQEERAAAVAARDLAQFTAVRIRYQQAAAKYDVLSQEAEKAIAFSRLLRGVTGVSLQRYVLGAMLSAVTAEANLLLERVHDGRYQIFRTLETTGSVRKAGLELEVLDRRSGAKRSVVSLSGGEKFLVALALSIGLSAVVQAQSGASKLGAIFIDEGFGTLDDASLHNALSVLAAIRDTHGMVGIISHVALLRESIHAGIQVKKQHSGSTLQVFYE